MNGPPLTGVDAIGLADNLPDFDVRDALHAYDIGFRGHNLVSYLMRNATHDPATHLAAIRQAHWYLGREIAARTGKEP